MWITGGTRITMLVSACSRTAARRINSLGKRALARAHHTKIEGHSRNDETVWWFCAILTFLPPSDSSRSVRVPFIGGLHRDARSPLPIRVFWNRQINRIVRKFLSARGIVPRHARPFVRDRFPSIVLLIYSVIGFSSFQADRAFKDAFEETRTSGHLLMHVSWKVAYQF